jgi:hypothetical protein
MEAFKAILAITTWIVLTTFTVMETLPWLCAGPTWISVSVAIISILAIIFPFAWMELNSSTYDPYDY